MIDERLKEKLLSMTWEGLREWSDPKSVERGKGYLNDVETPAVFADGSVCPRCMEAMTISRS